MAEDAEQFLYCALAICNSSVDYSLFRSLPHFIRLFYNLMSSLLSFTYILEINPLQYGSGKDIFPSNTLPFCLSDCVLPTVSGSPIY